MYSKLLIRLLCVVLLLSTASFAPPFSSKTDGFFITRTGHVENVEIVRLLPKQIIFRKPKGKMNLTIDKDDLYMYSTSLTGNIYINENGEEVEGEPGNKGSAKKTRVYTTDCKEIAVDNCRMDYNGEIVLGFQQANVSYTEKIPAEQVFIIYDVENDYAHVVTPFYGVSTGPEKVAQVVEETALEGADPEEAAFELKFHEVAKGETLKAIASKYGVQPEEIIEWNDLSPKIRTNAVLQEGMQLLIYVPVK